MKGIFLSLALLTAGFAHAGTVTIEPTGCINAYYCMAVTNDANESVAVITYSPHYGRLSAIINGVLWDSGLWALGSYNGPLQPTVTLTNIPLTDGSGDTIYMSIEFAGGVGIPPCHQQGRVCVMPHSPVTIVSGSIVQ